MPLFGNGGQFSSSWVSEISCIILHLLSWSSAFPFWVWRLYSETFMFPIIWYSKVSSRFDVLIDISQLWRLVCRYVSRGHKLSILCSILALFQLNINPSSHKKNVMYSWTNHNLIHNKRLALPADMHRKKSAAALIDLHTGTESWPSLSRNLQHIHQVLLYSCQDRKRQWPG